MAVKVTDATDPDDEASVLVDPVAFGGPPAEDVGEALRTLLALMPRVIRAWKRGASGSEEEPGSEMRALFQAGPLGPRHGPVIIALVHSGPLAVGDLARRLGLSLATVSLMVGELDRAGLVERHEDPEDRRRTLVSVREEYRTRFESFFAERIAPLRRALERMTPQMREHFVLGWRLLAQETASDLPSEDELPYCQPAAP
jgi:DNA-binding MarR family transcriptional regulator